MQTQFKYFAFISYSHKDSELAKWLQHEFEYYKLPSVINGRKLEEYKDLPDSFRPLFRDEDELAGGDLKPQIYEALANSQYLIVVCSPNSAQSNYVNDEITEFISLSEDNKRKIFPFIVDGKPHAKEKHEKECFPKALLELSDDKSDPIELIAGDVNATGKDHAFVKILAGTLKEKDIQFSDLWNRYEVEKAEKERIEREQRDKLLISQSHILSDKSAECVEQGDYYLARTLALRALPQKVLDPTDRPYVPTAEKVLRESLLKDDFILRGNRGKVYCAVFGDTKPIIATGGEDSIVRIWDCTSGRMQLKIDTGRGLPISSLVFVRNDEFLLVGFDKSEAPLKFDQISKAGVTILDIATEKFIYPGSYFIADEIWVTEKYSMCLVKFIDTIIGYNLSNYEKRWEIKVQDTKSWNLCSSAFNTFSNRIVLTTRTSMQVINAENGDSIFNYILNNPDRDCTCSDFSYDGSNLICGIGKRIEIVKIEGNKLISKDQFEKEIKIIRSCHISPLVVCVLDDNSILLYDYINSQIISLLQSSSEKVSYIDIDKEDKYVAIASWNKTVRIVSLCANYSIIGKTERPNTLKETKTSYLVYGNNSLIELSCDGREMFARTEGISSHQFYNNGSTCYYTKGEYGQTSLVAYSNGNENIIINNIDIDWCSQHRIYSSFVCFENNSVLYCNLERKIIYRDQSSTNHFITDISYECFMRLSHNKDYVVIVASTEMMFFDIKSLSVKYRIKRERDINDISISSDDKCIVIGDEESTMIILDAYTGKECHKQKLGSAINFAEFTPDNKKIILATENGTIHVYDMESNRIIREIYDETKNYTLRGFTKEAISSNGKYLLTGQWNGSGALHVIDLSNFEVVATYEYHLDSVKSAIFAENDRYIVTVSYDGQIIKNEFKPLQELIDENRLRFKDRSFTDIEKRKFYID